MAQTHFRAWQSAFDRAFAGFEHPDWQVAKVDGKPDAKNTSPKRIWQNHPRDRSRVYEGEHSFHLSTYELLHMTFKHAPNNNTKMVASEWDGLIFHHTLQILESSATLLHVLKRESVNLTKKKQASSWSPCAICNVVSIDITCMRLVYSFSKTFSHISIPSFTPRIISLFYFDASMPEALLCGRWFKKWNPQKRRLCMHSSRTFQYTL